MSVTGETIRLGIDAPQCVAVHRGEVFQSGQYRDRVEVKRAS
jgi:sRNA-binding carbon storage regulator CsrA